MRSIAAAFSAWKASVDVAAPAQAAAAAIVVVAIHGNTRSGLRKRGRAGRVLFEVMSGSRLKGNGLPCCRHPAAALIPDAWATCAHQQTSKECAHREGS